MSAKIWHAFNGLAVPCSGGARDDLGHGPVLVSNFQCAHSGFCRSVGGLQDIGATTSHRVLSRGADHNGLAADGRESIDVSTELDFDDIVLGQR